MQLAYKRFNIRIHNVNKGTAALLVKVQAHQPKTAAVSALRDQIHAFGTRVMQFYKVFYPRFVKMAQGLELYDANEFIAQFLGPVEKLQNEMVAFDKAQAGLTDGHLVPEAMKVNPPGGWGWLWWVGGAAALVAGYMVWTRGGHGSNLNMAKLPRYAGGTRRTA